VASLALTYFALRDIDFSTFLNALGAGHPAWLGASLAAFAAAYGVRVVRWSILFEPATRPRPTALVRALVAGEFFTSLLPVLRLGEVARVIVLHRAARTPRADAAGTVVAERTHDAAALLFLLFLAVPFAPAVTWLRAAAIFIALLAAGSLVGLLVLKKFGSRPIGLLLRPLAWMPGLSRAHTDRAAEGVLRGLRGLRSLRVASAAFVLSALFWCGVALSYLLALRVVEIHVGLDAGIIVAVATTFSLLLPSLPASVGIFEAAALVGLKPYGVGGAHALSGAVVIHVLTFVPFLVVGPFALRGHVLGPHWLTRPTT
jgi:uncharacterized protein (TIRG00374 family)